MRIPALANAIVLSALLVVSPSAQSHLSDALEIPFAPGGRIAMRLSAGEYRISASPEDQIRLQWSVRRQSQLREVEASTEVDGSEVTVVLDGPSSDFRVTIEVPERSDLSVRLSAGELGIDRIVGNKDIRLHAGEIRIDVGRPENYGRVEGTVWVGEIHADPFQIDRDGIFQSFDWRGDGEFRLRTRLKAGKLRLYSTSGEVAARPQ